MFAKVFAQIFDSSIAEDYRVRLVFEDFLKLATKDGIVDMTRESIARRTNVPLDIVTLGVDELEKPDKTSRTPDKDGRRIVRLDEHRNWGWRIVNFEKYRQSATKEMLRMSEADRKRTYRRKFPHTPSKKESTEREREAEQSHPRPDGSERVRDMSGTNHFPEVEIPSWEEVKLHAVKIGLVEWKARDWFDEMKQSGWKDSKNREVMDWRAYIARVKSWWEADGKPMTRPPSKFSKQTQLPIRESGNF